MRWVLIELGIVAGQALVQRGAGLVRSLLGARLALDINVTILEKALTLELRHFEDAEFYDQLTRARREASSRPLSRGHRELSARAERARRWSVTSALLVRYSPWAVAGAGAWRRSRRPSSRCASRARRSACATGARPSRGSSIYLEYVLANDDHAKEVKLFGLGPMLLGRYRTLAREVLSRGRALAVRRAAGRSCCRSWARARSTAATRAMALAAAPGSITLGNMTLYMVAFRQGQQAFQSMLAAIGGMYEDKLYMSNLFEYLAIPPVAGARRRRRARARRRRGRGGHPLRGRRLPLSGTPARRAWALRDIEPLHPARAELALVGQNGAGKTTLIKLLTRLYEPTEGRILLDGATCASGTRTSCARASA